MGQLTRFVAVAEAPAELAAQAASVLFCGHVHRGEQAAATCAGRMRVRLQGYSVRVAKAFDVFGDACPMRDFHLSDRPCRVCGLTL